MARPLAGLRVALLGERGSSARCGGSEPFAGELSRRLAARGAEVTVLGVGRDDAGPQARGAVRPESVSTRPPGPLRSIASDLIALRRTGGRFDVVYSLGSGAAMAARLARAPGTEVWLDMDGLRGRRSRDGPRSRRWLRGMEGLAVRGADRLLFGSAALAREVLARRGWRGWAHDVVPHAGPILREVDPSPLEHLRLAPGKYLLAMSGCEPESHLLELVRAHRRALVRHPLVILSNTNLPTAYARQLQAYSSELVRLPGPIRDPELLAPLRAHCRAYLHGDRDGESSSTLVQAMGAGAPIVAHDDPFNREVLSDAGLYFRDEVSLEAILVELVACRPHELAAFGDQARRRAAAEYTWERVADRYGELLLAAHDRSRA